MKHEGKSGVTSRDAPYSTESLNINSADVSAFGNDLMLGTTVLSSTGKSLTTSGVVLTIENAELFLADLKSAIEVAKSRKNKIEVK